MMNCSCGYLVHGFFRLKMEHPGSQFVPVVELAGLGTINRVFMLQGVRWHGGQDSKAHCW